MDEEYTTDDPVAAKREWLIEGDPIDLYNLYAAAVKERDEALKAADELAACVILAESDAHPAYSSTALWYGGIGGQSITPYCTIINGGEPGKYDWVWNISGPAREWINKRGFTSDSLNNLKEKIKEELSED